MKIRMEHKDVMMLNEDKAIKGMSIIKYLRHCDCEIVECYTKGNLFEGIVISPSGKKLKFRTYSDIITSVDIYM